MKGPCVLTIVDGWGIPQREDAPRFDTKKHIAQYIQKYPAGIISASGIGLGSSMDSSGNSAIGYTSLGTGMPPMNYILEQAMVQEDFYNTPAVQELYSSVQSSKRPLHIVVPIGGSYKKTVQQLAVFIHAYQEYGIKNPVVLHVLILPSEITLSLSTIKQALASILELPKVQIGTVVGSKYACDTSLHWNRTERAYRGIFFREGEETRTERLIDFISLLEEQKHTTEDLPPIILQDTPAYSSGDTVLFFDTNRRYTRQLVQACFIPGFSHMETIPYMFQSGFTLLSYETGIVAKILWHASVMPHGLSDILREHEISQMLMSDGVGYPLLAGYFRGVAEIVQPPDTYMHVQTVQEKDPLSLYKKHIDVLQKQVIKQVEDKQEVVVASLQYLDNILFKQDHKQIEKAYDALDTYIYMVSEHVLSLGGMHCIVGSYNAIDSAETVPVLCIADDKTGQAMRQGDIPEGNMQYATPCGSLLDMLPTILSYLNVEKPQHLVGRPLC